MKLFRPRAVAAGALAASVAVSALLLGGTPAFAAGALPTTGDALTIAPASGNQFVSPTLTTSGPCPVGSDNFYVKLYGGAAGSQMPDGGQLMKDPGFIGMSTTDPFTFQTSFNFKDTATDAGVASLNGGYVIEVVCQTELSTILRTFTAPLTFNAAGTSYTTPVVLIGTTTALGVAPASPQQAGTSVTLTATVTPASGGAPAGSVEFFDGAASLGSSATSGGVASLSTSALSVGTHSLTATFTGSGFSSSTSSASSYTITAAPAKASTTTLTVTPSGTAPAGSNVTLDAGVSITGGGAANGTVEFFDGANKISTKPVVAGAASYATQFAGVGTHTLKAVFVPADAAVQLGSEDSEDLSITGVPTQALQTITVSLVETGTLTISVADDTVDLPNFTLDATADKLSSAGPINPVTVTDTRLYEQGWSVSGQVTDFTSPAGSFSSTGLGWTPNVVTPPAGSVITPGAAVAPFTSSGLSTPKVLASAASDNGRGTTVLGADLLLKAPTTTLPGTYSALLTLTVV